MQGQLLNYIVQDNKGYIVGDNGQRYQFSGNEWKENRIPTKGERLDFEVDASGQAKSVFFALDSQNGSSHEQNSDQFDPNMHELYQTESTYNMFQWFWKCLRNLFNFSGRARRKEYWFYMLILFLLTIFINVFVLLVVGFMVGNLDDYTMSILTNITSSLLVIVFIIPSFAVNVRRMNDINHSGWWLLISFVPMIGSILFLIWMLKNTKFERNKWGSPAKSR